MAQEQSFKNHTRWDPLFHFVLTPIFLLNIVCVTEWYWHHRWQHHRSGPWAVLMSIALWLGLMLTRTYALKNQNRIIRMEEKLRLLQVCSPEELVELESLTMRQLIALRFASSAELSQLARRAVREKMEPKAIKAAIVSWRPDSDRV